MLDGRGYERASENLSERIESGLFEIYMVSDMQNMYSKKLNLIRAEKGPNYLIIIKIGGLHIRRLVQETLSIRPNLEPTTYILANHRAACPHWSKSLERKAGTG